MTPPRRSRPRMVGRVLAATGFVLAGALIGLALGVRLPAHVEIAGSDTRLWLQIGDTYDQVGIRGLIAGRRPTPRTVFGEPLGVRADINLDTNGLVDADGNFDAGIVPAYIQAFSDPQQVVVDARRALVGHLVWFTASGGGVALALLGGAWAYRRWRRGYDRAYYPDETARRLARAYRGPERRLGARVLGAVAVLVVVGLVPSSRLHPEAPVIVRADPILDGTPLQGAEIGGLLRPAVAALSSYIRTYFDQTNEYYDVLLAALRRRLALGPTPLPSVEGRNLVSFGFVTDRHCNIGMDRVTVAVLRSYHVRTLVSGGDDAFSGSFSFETACTRNLAAKSAQAGIIDVFVGGNHDSPMTIEAQRRQGIKTLVGDPVTVGGLTLLGSPDPRTSRYGQGIVPASDEAQRALVRVEGRAVGRVACEQRRRLVIVLHDPRAGEAALGAGCGRAALALDGHTHIQRGPDPIALPDGSSGYRFTGGSAGGAPGGATVDQSFASKVTVGPLNHDASISIVTVDAATSDLVGVTTFTFSPDAQISEAQQLVGS